VKSLDVEPTEDQLNAAGDFTPEVGARYEALPASLPNIISSTASEVTQGAGTEYEKAIALQSYFRSGDFVYDESAPVEEDFDGDSMAVIAAFLDVKRGYCVHFASAMAVMARSLGIPARVAVGYQPGTRIPDVDEELGDDFTSFEVTTHDLHAWPELFFAGVGWVRFEPTPSRGSVPDYSAPAVAGQVTEAPTPAPTQSSTATQDRQDDTTDAASGSTISAGTIWAWSLLLVLVAAFITPGAARGAQRRRRLRAATAGAPVAAWDEVRSTAFDLGFAKLRNETPRGFAVALSEKFDGDPAAASAVFGLLELVESDLYARPAEEGTVLTAPAVDAATRIISSLRARATRARRWRARILPPSLFATLMRSRLALRWIPPGSD
jgi:hypothetical protein